MKMPTRSKLADLLKLTILVAVLLPFSMGGAAEKEVAAGNQLPEDFTFEHRKSTAGVLPRRVDFIRIDPIGKAGQQAYRLSSGASTTQQDGRKDVSIALELRLTEAQCLRLYRDAVELGFFDLKGKYRPEGGLDGGLSTTISIVAGGKKKLVSVYGVDVPEMGKLLGRVRALSVQAFSSHVQSW